LCSALLIALAFMVSASVLMHMYKPVEFDAWLVGAKGGGIYGLVEVFFLFKGVSVHVFHSVVVICLDTMYPLWTLWVNGQIEMVCIVLHSHPQLSAPVILSATYVLIVLMY
jgi:hypothetical protein